MALDFHWEVYHNTPSAAAQAATKKTTFLKHTHTKKPTPNTTKNPKSQQKPEPRKTLNSRLLSNRQDSIDPNIEPPKFY